MKFRKVQDDMAVISLTMLFWEAVVNYWKFPEIAFVDLGEMNLIISPGLN